MELLPHRVGRALSNVLARTTAAISPIQLTRAPNFSQELAQPVGVAQPAQPRSGPTCPPARTTDRLGRKATRCALMPLGAATLPGRSGSGSTRQSGTVLGSRQVRSASARRTSGARTLLR